MPGLVIGGVRDKRVIPAALASSTMVSIFLLLFTAVERGRRGVYSKDHQLRARRAKQLRGRRRGARAHQLHGHQRGVAKRLTNCSNRGLLKQSGDRARRI